MKLPTRKPVLCSLTITFSFWWLLAPWTNGLAQNGCEKSLSEIRYEFLAFRFEEVIALASGCLHAGQLSREEKVQAYELLVLSYLELDELSQAKTSLKSLLGLNSDFVLHPAEPDEKVPVLMAEVRAEMARERKSKWRWIAIGAGVLAGTFAAILTTGGAGSSRPAGFPEPPGRPPGD
ncbi:MAG: hypothetical protein ACE5IY_22765 [bacterium]